MDPRTPLRRAAKVNDTHTTTTNPNPPRTEAEAVELTTDGLHWMLLHSAVGTVKYRALCKVHSAHCEVWLNAYDAAPESVRESLTRSGMTNVWAPAIEAALEKTEVDLDVNVGTPLGAFVGAAADGKLSDGAIKRLFQVLQDCGLFAAAKRRAMANALFCSAFYPSRAFEMLITDPNADTALAGPTRCSAGDAHNPPRHHSVRFDGDESLSVHDVLWIAARDPVAWRAFNDARLPFGARAMDEEWAYELTGACGCLGDQRISKWTNPLHNAIYYANDEAGEWLAARLPPKRLNKRVFGGATALIAALRSHDPLPRTVAALLSRVPDVDLTLRAKWDRDGSDECTAAEWIARYPAPQWLPSHLAAELKLKTEQFGVQYLPSAAVLCTEQLFVQMGVPRELVRLVLQYTALSQPHPWPNTQPIAAGVGTADKSPMFGLTHRPAEHRISRQKRGRDTALGASTDPSATAPLLRHKRTKRR